MDRTDLTADRSGSAETDTTHINSEQRDDDQAQDVASDALGQTSDLSEASEHGGKANPGAIIPDDTPDLVDTMNQMLTSGIIDNGAFAGEPMHDDEETRLGVTDADDEDADGMHLTDGDGIDS